jgi:hypothetical protein
MTPEALEKYRGDTLELLVRELLEDRDLQPGSTYRFRACPFCGRWLSNGHNHDEGHSQTSQGPAVCWLVRAARVLGVPVPKWRQA